MLGFVTIPLEFNPYSFEDVDNVDCQNYNQITL
jgi:hypothetical protein